MGWWERRRLPYNLIVGGAGLTTLAVLNVVGMLPPNSRTVFFPVIPVVVFGVMANVCYLLGPTLGLTFSTGLALLPISFVMIDWAMRVVRAVIGSGFL